MIRKEYSYLTADTSHLDAEFKSALLAYVAAFGGYHPDYVGMISGGYEKELLNRVADLEEKIRKAEKANEAKEAKTVDQELTAKKSTLLADIQKQTRLMEELRAAFNLFINFDINTLEPMAEPLLQGDTVSGAAKKLLDPDIFNNIKSNFTDMIFYFKGFMEDLEEEKFFDEDGIQLATKVFSNFKKLLDQVKSGPQTVDSAGVIALRNDIIALGNKYHGKSKCLRAALVCTAGFLGLMGFLLALMGLAALGASAEAVPLLITGGVALVVSAVIVRILKMRDDIDARSGGKRLQAILDQVEGGENTLSGALEVGAENKSDGQLRGIVKRP